jgi:putative Mn2+ efflux pump MntP
MSIISIVFIAIGLAMDCFAVSIASSMSYGKYDWKKILRLALFFGLFQGIMPLIGWLAGISFSTWIARFDHWFALVILCFLGGKMIYESLKHEKENKEESSPFSSLKTLTVLAIATSIDALATGLIFVPYGNIIFVAVSIIAVVSFLFAILGCVIGISVGKGFKLNVELIGGIILIAIGVKIFVEHICGG